jgi:tetratricopeptide (TPR) repeat protein/diadenosine tetraphosphatase ApaH/serine/threonine PP2A family protein phosphatase
MTGVVDGPRRTQPQFGSTSYAPGCRHHAWAIHRHEPPVGDQWLWLGRYPMARWGTSVACALALCLIPFGCHKSPPASPDELLRHVRAAAAEGQFVRAESLIVQIPTKAPEWAQAQLVVGEAALKAGRYADAVRYFQALARFSPPSADTVVGHFYAGEAFRDGGRLRDAAESYQTFLWSEPNNAAAHERLAFLLSATGQTWEALPHYLALIQSGTATISELALVADLDRAVEQRPFLERCHQQAADDPWVALGLAAQDYWDGDVVRAEQRLRQLLATHPDLAAGQAFLGELLVSQSESGFRSWHDHLPPSVANHPQIWFVRGLWSRRHGQLEQAARCFWEVVRQAPTHRRATYQLGQVLTSLKHPGAEAIERQAHQLVQLTQTIDVVLRTEGRYHEPLQRTVELLEGLGRYWEACAWSLVARQRFPEAAWPGDVFSRLAGRLSASLPLVDESANPALRYDFSGLPPFSWPPEGSPLSPTAAEQAAANGIRFLEEAEPGPNFTYFNGNDPLVEPLPETSPSADSSQRDVLIRIRSRTRSRIFEQNGGGVGVVDYDQDQRPDLFFPQGAVWKHGEDGPRLDEELTDRIFRNIGGQRFVDVSPQVRLVDRGYGQGCAAGDIDNDGFPDLYVANIGRNQLYRNNGDGTFTDVTPVAMLAADDWTASCAIVDLDGNGLADLYDVNYLTGPDVYKAVCEGHMCSPKVFAPAPDRVWINQGDGQFLGGHPLAEETHGKGLGIVAIPSTDRRHPLLFIANDQVPNYLLRIQLAATRLGVQFEDVAFVAGVALNQDGVPMASMGIAADDANGDGLIDLYVSTFKDEASMLFLQDAQGLFVDAANPAGLRGPTWPYVGWGAQFLDADLDGAVDLVGVNGHVDDYRPEGGEYHMPPQFFRNLGAGRFVELSAADVGPFFAQKRLGRGLARLDWNGDGRMDFAVSNIGDRASLVTNFSQPAGQFLNVRLHARTTARDAIGSRIVVAAADRSWTKFLLAGDGYMASNERVVQFGLGAAATVADVRIEWPSGALTMGRRIPSNCTLQVVEGTSYGIVWEHPDRSSVVPVEVQPPNVDGMEGEVVR